MEKILLSLREYILKNLPPSSLIRNENIQTTKDEWDILWTLESEKIKWDFITHGNGKINYNASVLTGLVTLCDEVQHYLTKHAKVWQGNSHASLIRLFYKNVNLRIQLFIEFLSNYNPEAFGSIPYSENELGPVKLSLKKKFHQVERHLGKFIIDNVLQELFFKTINWHINSRRLTRRTNQYLMLLMDRLLFLVSLDTELFKAFLYQFNFNQPEIFMYWVNSWNMSLLDEPGVYEQLEFLIMQQDRLVGEPTNFQMGLLEQDEPLHIGLAKYLKEKKIAVSELIDLRRARLRDSELAKSAVRIKTNLPVAQLGLFIRLQIEKGVLMKDNVGKLFGFYATHFYTPQTESISSQSLQKKSTEIEYATAQKLKALLISMINWLNENFNVNE